MPQPCQQPEQSFAPAASSEPEMTLPNAYRLYSYGPRQIWWSPQVQVAEPNHGIMVNAEFPTRFEHLGTQDGIIEADYQIRNQTWATIGPFIKSAESNRPTYIGEGSKGKAGAPGGPPGGADDAGCTGLDWKSSHSGTADFSQAMDRKQLGRTEIARPMTYKDAQNEHFDRLRKERTQQGLIPSMGSSMDLEILDDRFFSEFWANPEGVIADSIE